MPLRIFSPTNIIFIFLFFLMQANVCQAELQKSTDDRYHLLNDKTVLDQNSGLMWFQEDSYLHTGHWIHWGEALQYAKKMNVENYAGYSDWRVPLVKELKTLFEPKKNNSKQLGKEMMIHIDPIFSHDGCGALWSSEANGQFSGLGVIFNSGEVFSHPKKSRVRKAARLVRTHQLPQP